MPYKCIVPGCKTDYLSCKAKLSTFTVPKNDELREKWQEALKLKKPLKEKNVVCEKHFRANNIIGSSEHKNANGNILAEVRSFITSPYDSNNWEDIYFIYLVTTSNFLCFQKTFSVYLTIPFCACVVESSWPEKIAMLASVRAHFFHTSARTCV